MLSYRSAQENDFLLRMDAPAFANQIHAGHRVHRVIRHDQRRSWIRRGKLRHRRLRIAKRPHLKWFVESDPAQAREISDRTRRTVICPTTAEVFGANFTTTLV